jgi:hypothetical protein
MTTPTPGSNLIGCSAKELREIKDYVHKLERDLHSLRAKHERIQRARSLRLARALGQLPRHPVAVLAECWRVIFERRGARPPSQPALKHRHFAALERRVRPSIAAIVGAAHYTVLAEIAQRCRVAAVVTLRGCAPEPPREVRPGTWYSVGPHDYELCLTGVEDMTLIVDTEGVSPTSPWAGVFDIQDMSLNLAMAGLVELVRSRGGKVVFVRASAGPAPPLRADFQRDATIVDSLADLALDALPR